MVHIGCWESHCFPQGVVALCFRASLLKRKGEGVFSMALHLRLILGGNDNRNLKIPEAKKLPWQAKDESFAV